MYVTVIHEEQQVGIVALGLVRRAAADGTTRRVRTAAGVTLAEVGRAAGVEAQTVCRWESGRRSPRGHAAERYAAVIIALIASVGDSDDAAVSALRDAIAEAAR